jgi:formate dehydrogenase iron-sulfur subunit
VDGLHAFFIIRGDERAYNLPPNPVAPTAYLKDGWRSSAIAGGMLLAGTIIAFLGAGRK